MAAADLTCCNGSVRRLVAAFRVIFLDSDPPVCKKTCAGTNAHQSTFFDDTHAAETESASIKGSLCN